MTSQAAGIPPQGVESNFDNPKSLYPDMLATVVLCSSLTTLFTAARLFTKWRISAWALEDYLLMLAWGFTTVYDYVFLAAGTLGMGRHLWDVRAADFVTVTKFGWILSWVYSPAIFFAKSALLFQLSHIFAPTKAGFMYWAVLTLVGINLAFYISALFTTLFQCLPQSKIWHPEREDGHCINFRVAYLVTGGVNVVSDFLILILPIAAIWRLQLAPKRKLGISAVFATGLIAFVSSLCRFGYTFRFFTSGDASYIPGQVGMWTIAEMATIILCTCFPMMPRFVQIIIKKTASTKDNESNPSFAANRHLSTTAGPPRSLHTPNRSEAWGDPATAPKNQYIPLGETEYSQFTNPYHTAGHKGIKRTVSIELTSHASSNTVVAGHKAGADVMPEWPMSSSARSRGLAEGW